MENLQADDLAQIAIKKGLEKEVYNYLHKYIMQDMKNTEQNLVECKSRITAVRKINKNKNEAIDALCDLNNK